MMENVVSSEVNSFSLDLENSGDLTTSKFIFSVPPELKYSLQRNGFQSLRRYGLSIQDSVNQNE